MNKTRSLAALLTGVLGVAAGCELLAALSIRRPGVPQIGRLSQGQMPPDREPIPGQAYPVFLPDRPTLPKNVPDLAAQLARLRACSDALQAQSIAAGNGKADLSIAHSLGTPAVLAFEEMAAGTAIPEKESPTKYCGVDSSSAIT